MPPSDAATTPGAPGPAARLAAAALLAGAIAVALARVGSLPTVGGVRLAAPWFLGDFRAAAYYPTRAFWEGLNPYGAGEYLARYPVDAPFAGYAPATFLVYLPFGALPVPIASGLYFIVSVGLTLALAAAALRMAGWRATPTGVMAVSGALLLSRPGQWNLLLGQMTLPAVLGTYAALAWASAAPWLAGVGITFALLKPTYGVPLMLLLLARGRSTAVAWGVGLAAAVNLPLLAIVIHRGGGIGPFLDAAFHVHSAWIVNPANTPLTTAWRVDAPALVSTLRGGAVAIQDDLLLGAVVLTLAGLVLARLARRDEGEDRYLSEGIICCAVLLAVYHKAYDLLLLTLPALSLARRWRLGSVRSADAALMGGSLALLALNYLSTESVLAALHPGPLERGLLVSLNGWALLILFAAYLGHGLLAARIGRLEGHG